MLKYLLLCLFFIQSLAGYSTTWIPAQPYTQKTQGQNINIKAVSYNPHSGMVTDGKTDVYKGSKLLYSIDSYFRGNIFTSDDGKYLFVLYSNDSEMRAVDENGKLVINYDDVIMSIYKDGTFLRYVKLGEVVNDKEKCKTESWLFYGYYYTKENIRKSYLYDVDMESFGPDGLTLYDKVRDNSYLRSQPAFVLNNTLCVITNYHTMVKIDLSTLAITIEPVDKAVSLIKKIPHTTRKYKKLKYPHHLEAPKMMDETNFDTAFATGIGVKLNTTHDGHYLMFVYAMVNRNGQVEDLDVMVYDRSKSKSFDYNSIDKELSAKATDWIKKQKIGMYNVPKQLDKFKYEFLLYFD